MPRRRRHALIEGESPTSRHRRLLRQANNSRRERSRGSPNLGGSQVSTPQDSPNAVRCRQRRHYSRRVQGLDSVTPPTPCSPNLIRTPDGSSPVEIRPRLNNQFALRSMIPLRTENGLTDSGRSLPTCRALIEVTIHNCLKKVGLGRPSPYLRMDSHPVSNTLRNKFFDYCSNYSLEQCQVCKEVILSTIHLDSNNPVCKRCSTNYQNNNNDYLFDYKNNMDPFHKGCPFVLPKLDTIEELLISNEFVIM